MLTRENKSCFCSFALSPDAFLLEFDAEIPRAASFLPLSSVIYLNFKGCVL